MATYVLYNPFSGNGKGEQHARSMPATAEEERIYTDLTKLESYQEFFDGLQAEDRVILCGGDGTLNRFACDTREMTLDRDLYYYPAGSGNDFWRDLEKGETDGPVLINSYLKDLPTVTVNGKEAVFINGVGYGIDGYCCEVGDKIRATSNKPVNYTSIAIKGLLFHFRPRTATVVVDGKQHTFTDVWIAPVMHGRYYGGGMMMAPAQIRNNEDGTLSLGIFRGRSKLRTLMIFPSIFKGEHINHPKATIILTGKEFTVSFDRPTPLQIDGETVLDVESYTVKSAVCKAKEASTAEAVAQ